jgi:hypothetical protein
MKKISVILLACSMGLAVQAQIIDPLTGSLSGYTTTLVLDNSLGVGSGVSFTSSGSGLSANFVGTVADPEQALSLAPVSSFSTTFAVGDMLTVNVAVPVSTIQEDLGLAIAATATPTAAGSGNSYNSRTTFDWASVSVRPSQGSVRGGDDISGTLTTSYNTAVASSGVSQLFIQWNSADFFTLGYVDTSAVSHTLYTATFAGASTIGTAIGFYGDMRDAGGGTTLGTFSNLAISTIPVPEPTTMALCGLGGLLGLAGWMRRKQ